MPEVPAVRAWPLLLSLALQLGAAAGAPQPWHCAPCSAERLALCPPVPASCPEATRPAGCGCCPTCALPLGAACGVATARCARGLSCRALPGEPRPLHALTRGQGACMPAPSAEATETTDPAAPETVSPESAEMTQEQLLDSFHLMATSSEDLPILWNAINNYESMKALEVTDIKKWKVFSKCSVKGGLGFPSFTLTPQERRATLLLQEPCQRELYKVLDRLAREQQKAGDRLYKFYLPNCNKNGFYHSKQCETSLEGEPGLCWCVYPWSGKKILGSTAVRGDPKCHQYFNSQN